MKVEKFMAAMKAQSSDFPLRSSLFWMDGERVSSTWGYYVRGTDETTRRMIRKQAEYESNVLTAILYHASDPDCDANPFSGSPKPEEIMRRVFAMQDPGWDLDEVARWRALSEIGFVPGNYLIPCLFCGDDGRTTCNEAFTAWFGVSAVVGFCPYAAAYLIATEASKTMSVAVQERLVLALKQGFATYGLKPKPIGVHNQGTGIAPSADFLAYEFHNHPKDGDGLSVDDVRREAREVLARWPKPVWFQELNMNCEGARARDQSQALRDMAADEPRIVGLPGPI